jgi:HlyD family secretion protein
MRAAMAFFALCLLTGCQPKDGAWHGYVEGEYVMMAPTTGGILQTLSITRGQEVAAGAALFSLDLQSLTAARDAAAAAVEEARAQWNDLVKGERPEEIDVILKQKAQAEAELQNAKKENDRVSSLAKSGAVSRSAIDSAKAAFESATARVEELEARLKASALGAREDRIAAARAAMAVAEQNLVQADRKLKEAAPLAPAAARVEDTYYRPGEFVEAGHPVVSLLPPENVKIRFFVPERSLSSLTHGQTVHITCDGCGQAVEATITFISSQTEFTPPVIYSVGSRDKLVFMIEARAPGAALHPGQPVDVRP